MNKKIGKHDIINYGKDETKNTFKSITEIRYIYIYIIVSSKFPKRLASCDSARGGFRHSFFYRTHLYIS